jgi:vacuolar-type H+-ATPase subunit I/STV1
MSVPIRSSDELLAALREHPEWRDAIRREILTEELLGLPARFEQAEAERKEDQKKTWEAIRSLTASQERTDATLRSFIASTQAFQRSMEEFRSSMEEFRSSMLEFRSSMEEFRRSMEEFKQATERRLRGIELELDHVVGKSMEGEARRRLGNYLRDRVRKLRGLDENVVNALIDTALDSGHLTEAEGEELGEADALVAGKDKETGKIACVAVEVSRTLDKHDVDRAVRRSRLFLKASRAAVALDPEAFREFLPAPPEKAYALVVGRRITEEARREAERAGVVFAKCGNGYDREGR